MRDDELKRLQALEQLVRALMSDMQALREHVGAPRGDYASLESREPRRDVPPDRTPARAFSPEPTSPRPVAVPPRLEPATDSGSAPPVGAPAPRPNGIQTPKPAAGSSAWNLEELIGRYGTVALGSAVILAGVGVLISWAIAQGLFGPLVRLALAAMLAATCAGVGLRLRQRGAERFGNVMLALSLALTQLVAWGAGPALGVVPNVVAFALAAAASIAVALLAFTHEEEALFAVGVGGALLAPFVTMGDGGPLSLIAYGLTILTAAMWALRRQQWMFAPVLLVVGAMVYGSGAIEAMPVDASGWLRAGPFFFTLALAWGALLFAAPAALIYAFIGVGVSVAHPWIRTLSGADPGLPLVPLAGAALLTCYLAMRLRGGGGVAQLAAIALPFATLGVALLYLPGSVARWNAVVPALWGLAALGAAAMDQQRRESHAFVAAASGLVAIGIAAEGLALPLALLAYGVLVVRIATAFQLRAAVVPAILALGYVVLVSFVDLAGLPGYRFPFRSEATISAGASVLALLLMAHIYRADRKLERTVQIVALLVTFFWIRFELAAAFSADAATFSLIIYYAIAGSAALAVGRSRGMPQARHAGLLIACYAGVKALWEASDLEPIALRFGAFMLVGVFLLAVAYRYWPKRPPLPVVEPLAPEAK